MKKIVKALQRSWKEILVFIAVLGPGIITAIADNDAGGVGTYTVAASMYGVASTSFIILEILLLAITQDVGSRIALVTKKGLGDLVRENFGVKLSLLIFAFYFIVNEGVVLQNISGLKSAFKLMEFPWQISLLLVILLMIMVIIRFDYSKIQRVFLVLGLFYLTYIISAFSLHPNWKQVLQDAFLWPTDIKITPAYLFSRLAVLGTTITAWGQFFLQSYIVDKKLTEEHLKYERAEIYIGSLITNFISLMMIIAVSYTLYAHHIKVNNAYDAALAIKPVAGNFAYSLFAAGLLGASILGLVIVPLATAYVFAELFGYEGSLDSEFKKGKFFYGFFTFQLLIAYLITLIPSVNLFKFTLYADFLNSLMLPVIFYFLIKFGTDKKIMGEYKIGGLTLFLLKLFSLLIGITLILLVFMRVLKFF